MESSSKRSWRSVLPLAAVIAGVVALAIAATRLGELSVVRGALESIRSGADEWWAVPLFVLLYLLCTTALIPVALLSAAGALAWGWKLGGTIELLTCTVVALVPWAIGGRGLGKWVEKRVPFGALRLDLPMAFLLLRIVPIVPYAALNYLAGAARIPAGLYVGATFLGSIPSVYLFAWFVDTMGDAALGTADQVKIAGACALLAAALLMGRAAARRVGRRLRAARTVPPPDGAGLHSASPAPPPE